MFGNKCEVKGLVIHDQNSNYTQTFKVWCTKLEEYGITLEDVARGIKHLEEAIRDAVRTETEIWPPSYAEFIGHCQKQKQRAEWSYFKGLPKSTLSKQENKLRMDKLMREVGLR